MTLIFMRIIRARCISHTSTIFIFFLFSFFLFIGYRFQHNHTDTSIQSRLFSDKFGIPRWQSIFLWILNDCNEIGCRITHIKKIWKKWKGKKKKKTGEKPMKFQYFSLTLRSYTRIYLYFVHNRIKQCYSIAVLVVVVFVHSIRIRIRTFDSD